MIFAILGKHTKVIGFFWSLIFILFISCSTNEVEKQPNIIIFFTDDQGYADVGCYGAEGFETPNIDQLADEGIKFMDFYVPATVCTPSRAGLLTGQYPKRVGLHEAVLFPFSENGLDPNTFTLAEMLKESGYTTSCIGKWHLGHKKEYMPNNHGFDAFYGVPYSNDMDNYYYNHNDLQAPPLPFYRNTEMIGEGMDQRYLTKMYTEETVQQIKNRHKDNPFFIYLAHNMPHLPLFASEKFLGKSEKGLYGDVIMELDWSAGEIVRTLKEEGIYENTIIIFTSDNGPRVGSANPLRGFKAETWEGGQRVPGIIAWPNHIPKGKISHELVSTLDIYPTLAKLSGSTIKDNLIMDGIDVSHHLLDPENVRLAARPFFFYGRDGHLEAVRVGKWKLHILKTGGWNKIKEGDFPVSLYNLEEDISEQINLAAQFPQIVARLKIQLENFDSKIK
jgi:arylsulfatase A-like enzyme